MLVIYLYMYTLSCIFLPPLSSPRASSVRRLCSPRARALSSAHVFEGEKYYFFKSYYVDDATFTLLNREDAIRATKLIVSHFKRFSLTVHTDSRSLEEGSKTEALYIPPPRKEPCTEEELLAATADIVIDDDPNCHKKQ